MNTNEAPSILAPAGNRQSFLAAVAAGADAVYCGFKRFSARMAAENFNPDDLARLTTLAHENGTRVFVAFNSMLKPDELDSAARLVSRLSRQVRPDALIVQDLALIRLARQIGFPGELHLSTLANFCFPGPFDRLKKSHGIDCVVLPRELSIDEIKIMAAACPNGPGLEVFVHGALCYGVSGRCYWSSYLGGKSGLRGRCVQPCRRRYAHKNRSERFFSCLDLSIDILAKTLLPIPEIRAWKIEGRKKGPHYVYYTTKAYRLIRDHGKEPEAKKEAAWLLARSLGRPGTHYNFLPQRSWNPAGSDAMTASGLFLGRLKGPRKSLYLIPREQLLAGDLLRVGYEDEPGHFVYRVGRAVPKKGRLNIAGKNARPESQVFLIDRREKELESKTAELGSRLDLIPEPSAVKAECHASLPQRSKTKARLLEMHVTRHRPGKGASSGGLWISEKSVKSAAAKSWWWLPPVTWPGEQEQIGLLVDRILAKGARNFVLNSPWQVSFFKTPKHLNLWAGPFCNIANPLAVSILAELGFSGAIVSPEISRSDFGQIPENSPLPLGAVISGNWPLCISRILPEGVSLGVPFTSPKGEAAWAARHGSTVWVYPDWRLDITGERRTLQKAGYCMFVHIEEPVPKGIKLKKRQGMWNWNHGLVAD